MPELFFRPGEEVLERYTRGSCHVLGKVTSTEEAGPGITRVIYLRPCPKGSVATSDILVRQSDSCEVDCPPIRIEHHCPGGSWVSGNQPAH